MKNRILVIGDELFGTNGEAATLFSELLLCENPTRAIQFALYAPVKLTLPALLTRAPVDILGKQAARIVLGVGLRELRTQMDAEKTDVAYNALIDEILSKTNSVLYIVTIPQEALPEWASEVKALNTKLIALEENERIHVLDFASFVSQYNELQLERGKFARSLYDESNRPTSLCHMLLGLFIQKQIFNTNKEIP
jgi:hypothetical protein